MFIVFAVSTILASISIKDEDFIKYNKNYIVIKDNKITLDEFNKYASYEKTSYILPGNSIVNFTVPINDYYQTDYEKATMSGSLSSIEMINKGDITAGKMPTNETEIIVDESVLNNMISNSNAKQAGYLSINDFIGKKVNIGGVKEYTITGLVSLKSPSIYTNTSEFITIINNSSEVYDNYMGTVETDTKKVQDFKLYNDQITLTEGVYPQNDYETIINENYKETFKIGNTVDEKINDNKLKVVGYYHSDTGLDKYLVTENTIKYNLINTKEDIMVYSKDKEQTLKHCNANLFDIHK